MFIALYLSLYVAFVLGIFTLDRAYEHFFTAVEQSPLPDSDKLGCRVRILSDVTYVLFTLSFGDNLKDVLSEGRQDAMNVCGGMQVRKYPLFFPLSSLFSPDPLHLIHFPPSSSSGKRLLSAKHTVEGKLFIYLI